MPQMSPILWVNLYAAFTIILVVFIVMTFYIKTPGKSSSAPSLKTEKSLNWKW